MTISAPTATWLGDTSDLTPGFDVNVGEPGSVIAGQVLHSEWTPTGGSSWTDFVDRTLTVSDLVDLAFTVSGSALSPGVFDFRFRVESAAENGDWSSLVTVTLAGSSSSVGSRIVAQTSSHSFTRKRYDELLAAIRATEERAADLSVKAGKRQLRAAAAAAKQASKETITAREAHALAQSLNAAASAKQLADRLDDAKKAVNQAYAILGQQDDDAMVAFLMMN